MASIPIQFGVLPFHLFRVVLLGGARRGRPRQRLPSRGSFNLSGRLPRWLPRVGLLFNEVAPFVVVFALAWREQFDPLRRSWVRLAAYFAGGALALWFGVPLAYYLGPSVAAGFFGTVPSLPSQLESGAISAFYRGAGFVFLGQTAEAFAFFWRRQPTWSLRAWSTRSQTQLTSRSQSRPDPRRKRGPSYFVLQTAREALGRQANRDGDRPSARCIEPGGELPHPRHIYILRLLQLGKGR